MCTLWYDGTSCSNNDGLVCVNDFIPFVRSFRYFLNYILTRCNALKLNRS